MYSDDPNTVFPVEGPSGVLGVSEASISTLETGCVLRLISEGSCEPDEIPARILVILQGQSGWSDVTMAASPQRAAGPGSVVGAEVFLAVLLART